MSMGAPTGLPSAAALSNSLAREYEVVEGEALPKELHQDLEAFARFVHSRGELRDHLIRKVPWDKFRRNPNAAHQAVADLLLVSGISAAVSTNYDTHIEDAATALGERDFIAALDGDHIARLPNRYRPLLKIHGCAHERENTVWLVEQLAVEPIKARIERSRMWAEYTLRQHDLLFVGFWSDWAYLNGVLESVVTNVETREPRKVIVVDPKNPPELQEKASGLWAWATGSEHIDFIHVRERAEVFMEQLVLEVGHLFLRRLLNAGKAMYEELAGEPAPDNLNVPRAHSVSSLYNLRRDLTGVGPADCVATISPAGLEVLGAIMLKLLHLGADLEGPVIRINGERIRLISAGGQLMSRVRARIDSGPPTSHEVDRVVCVGGVPDAGVSSVIRGDRRASIARPSLSAQWECADRLIGELFPGAAA